MVVGGGVITGASRRLVTLVIALVGALVLGVRLGAVAVASDLGHGLAVLAALGVGGAGDLGDRGAVSVVVGRVVGVPGRMVRVAGLPVLVVVGRVVGAPGR